MAAATESVKNWLHGLTGTRSHYDEIADERDRHIEWQARNERQMADHAQARGDLHSARVHWGNVAFWHRQRRPEIVAAIEADKGLR